MRTRTVILLAAFALLVSPSFATPTGDLISWAETTFASVGLGDWRGISILLAVISIMLAGLAFMFAEPLNSPQLKAWANEELAQAFVTAAILITTVGVLDFADTVIYEQVTYAPASPFTCDLTTGETCTVQTSNQYLEGLINMSLEGARESFVKAIEVMKQQSKGQTMSCGTLLIPPCFMYYNSLKNNAYMLLDYERYTQEIELYNSILYSLQIQRFFSMYAANIVGPFLLLLGIIGRNFFATRRLGGLLMAIGLGLLIVFPGMYIWNAFSLNVALYGDDILDDTAECPEACKKAWPIAYTSSSGPVYFASELPFGEDRSDEAHAKLLTLLNGSQQEVDGYQSCAWWGNHTGVAIDGEEVACPEECRELPYPYYTSVCQDNETELACNHVPKGCKLIRNSTYEDCNNDDPDADAYCPDYCKMIPPLAGDNWDDDSSICDVCADAPMNCRVAIRNDSANMPDGLFWRPETCILPQGLNDEEAECVDTDDDGECDNAEVDAQQQAIKEASINCPSVMNENETCVWVVPDPPDIACEGPSCCIGNCRQEASFSIAPVSSTAANTSAVIITVCNEGDPYGSYDNCAPSDSGCTDYCIQGACLSASPSAPNSGCEEYMSGLTCADINNLKAETPDVAPALSALYPYCASNPSSPLYYNLSATCWKFPNCMDKDGDNECDPQKECVGYGPDKADPSTRCNGCINASVNACLYSPPTAMDCSEDCDETGEDAPLKVSPAEFAKTSQQWMFGRDDIKNVASLLVPAYLLPLLNVAVTLIFIRTFSPIFGGDIEIPGWTKVL